MLVYALFAGGRLALCLARTESLRRRERKSQSGSGVRVRQMGGEWVQESESMGMLC